MWLLVFAAPSARCFRGLSEVLPAGGRGATFYRCWAVPPPCGEAVCGVGVWPAVPDGGIDFQTWLPIIARAALPKYYRMTANLVVFKKSSGA